VLGDGVDQERGIAVIDAIEKRGKVYGHWGTVLRCLG
jgi:hypothetical protein